MTPNAVRRLRRRVRAVAGGNPVTKRLVLASLVVTGLFLYGVIGYLVIEGVSVLDAVYMTMITVSTVGFREVIDLSDAGQIHTIMLIAGGVAAVSYTALTGAEFLIEGHLRHIIERRRMDRRIAALNGHTIICGFGRVGRHIAAQLHEDDKDFVIVDDDHDKDDVVEGLGYLHVLGNATEEHVLEEAGIERASALVACVNSDADNVLVTLTAKGLNPEAHVIARSKADENERKFQRAGADRVIAPAHIGGRRIAQILTRPAVADFLDRIGGTTVDFTLEELPVIHRSHGSLVGRTLRDAEIRSRYNVTVVAVRHAGDQNLDTHPDATAPLVEGDVLVVLGSTADVARVRDDHS